MKTTENKEADATNKNDDANVTNIADENKKKQSKKEKNKVPLYKLFAFADRLDLAMMLVGTLAAMVDGMTQPIMTFILGDVVDAFGGGALESVLHRVTKVIPNFLYLGITSGIASFLGVTCWTITGERQSARIRALYLKAILRQDIGYFDKEMTTGQVIERMSGDTLLIQNAIGERVAKFMKLTTTFFGGFIVAFAKGWLLTLVMLSTIPPIVMAGAIVSRMMSGHSTRNQATYGEAGNVAEQTISSIRTVASFNGESHAVTTYDRLIHKVYKSGVKEGATTGLGMGTVFMTMFSSYGLAVWYGSKLIVNEGYNGGIVINILLAVVTGAMSIGQTTSCITAFAEGQAAAYRIFEVIKRIPDIDVSDTSGIVLEDINGDIELKDVYFSYPARPNHLIFDGFSLQVLRGTTMAIVGESGSGKSTIINLVERFYDPKGGEVLIDGINIKTMKLGWIRQKIGLVSQEPLLFATTIRENICYGKEDATIEEIRRAIQLANAATFVDKLPLGIDTMVGERGIQFSGGQKQRIAIARAIIKNPKILLLDEATSALDLESERVVQEALNRIMLERTTIIVSHRLSTVRSADMIAVVHQGKIVEKGAHAELLDNSHGAYSQLIHLQEMNQDKYLPSHGNDFDIHLQVGTTTSTSSTEERRQSRSIFSVESRNIHLFNEFAEENSPVESDATKEQSKETKNNVSMRRLLVLNRPEIPILIAGSIMASIHGVLFPLLSILISGSIKTFYEPPHQLLKDSRFWALMFVVLGIVALLSIPVEYFLFGIAGGKLIERIRSLTFKSVVHQEINWFDKPENSSGSICARLSTDALNVKRIVGDDLALNVQTITTIIAGFLVAVISCWKLTLIVIVVIPLIGLQGYFQIKFLRGFSANAKGMYEEASQVANDAVSGIRTVASYCAEHKVIKMYHKRCDMSIKQGIREGIIGGLVYGLSFVMFYFSYALCFYVGAKFVQNGEAAFGQVFRVFFALVLSSLAVGRTSASGSDTTKAKDSTASVFRVLDRKSKIDSSSDEGMILPCVRGQFELHNVTFTYPSRPNSPVLRDLCLIIPSGKTVALVGESGSGKSTVISLLERFYDIDSGKILFDGVELQNIRVGWLRQQIGLVAQEPVLFNDTIRTNIAYGKQGDVVTEEEIIAVAKAANAHQFVSALPDGYNTIVGERGIQLSGGQKQRVAIARAILKDPKVLLLDEATSALDAESENAVQDALDTVMIGRTTVVVAHRLSTIKNSDIIAVLENGKVVEKGRHEELMHRRGGVYASLVYLDMHTE